MKLIKNKGNGKSNQPENLPQLPAGQANFGDAGNKTNLQIAYFGMPYGGNPDASVAVFAGSQFSSESGTGGESTDPNSAWQLGFALGSGMSAGFFFGKGGNDTFSGKSWEANFSKPGPGFGVSTTAVDTNNNYIPDAFEPGKDGYIGAQSGIPGPSMGAGFTIGTHIIETMMFKNHNGDWELGEILKNFKK